MARGVKGAFGGTKINTPWIWGAFCLAFLLGLADFRRPLSLRNLDLVMLLSPTASLWFFNHGDVFTAVPLFYPALVWVVAARRCGSGSRVAARASRVLWPTWVLLAATVFLAGFRVGLNVEALERHRRRLLGRHRRGAHRVRGRGAVGQLPDRGRRCPRAARPTPRARSATTSRRTAAASRANPQGDTYGPTAYEAYIPGYLIRRLEREVGRPSRGAPHVDPVRPARR